MEALERILATEGDVCTQAELDKQQRVSWIHSLAEWEVMGTFTFTWESSQDSARRLFERFMSRQVGRVSYFYSIEPNPSRDGHHVHSLWADCRSVYRKEAWSAWFQRYGRVVIEPVRSKGDSEGYAAKYLTKPNAWWNVHLQWHRLHALSGRPFILSTCSV